MEFSLLLWETGPPSPLCWDNSKYMDPPNATSTGAQTVSPEAPSECQRPATHLPLQPQESDLTQGKHLGSGVAPSGVLGNANNWLRFVVFASFCGVNTSAQPVRATSLTSPNVDLHEITDCSREPAQTGSCSAPGSTTGCHDRPGPRDSHLNLFLVSASMMPGTGQVPQTDCCPCFIILPIFLGHPLCARHTSKHHTCIISHFTTLGMAQFSAFDI